MAPEPLGDARKVVRMPRGMGRVEVLHGGRNRPMGGAALRHPVHGRIGEGLHPEVSARPLLGQLHPPPLVPILRPIPIRRSLHRIPAAPRLGPESLYVLVLRRVLLPDIIAASAADVIPHDVKAQARDALPGALLAHRREVLPPLEREEEVGVPRGVLAVGVQSVRPPAQRAAEASPSDVPCRRADPGVDLEAPPMMGAGLPVPGGHDGAVLLRLAEDMGALPAIPEKDVPTALLLRRLEVHLNAIVLWSSTPCDDSGAVRLPPRIAPGAASAAVDDVEVPVASWPGA
mmetsp:Transcript_15934/g.46080  ORF Transcript_15934/g.46080 Transcript_15934/m.46080 type:complete len:288 (+) Transcript_15934:1156-2019(+)